jgi:hypothetical protein
MMTGFGVLFFIPAKTGSVGKLSEGRLIRYGA